MQLISYKSKILIAALLSCLFILSWENGMNSLPEPVSFAAMDIADAGQSINASIQHAESIWVKLGGELKLDHKTQTAQVQKEIRRLLADRKHFNHIINSAAPYLYYIFNQTQAKGLPAEIALIPFIESEFNPNDHSNKGALGLWQLMPGTARELGVKIRSGYDGRRNLIASTKAALAYFKDLKNTYKDNWYLAIAAYNCGPGNVNSATRRAGSRDFFKLPLPLETKYYVPRLLAVAEIIKHPKKYGIELPEVANEPFFEKLAVEKPVSLSSIAKKTGTDLTTLNKLNPDHKAISISTNTTAAVLVPKNKAPAIAAQLKHIAQASTTKKMTSLHAASKKKPAHKIVAHKKPSKHRIKA